MTEQTKACPECGETILAVARRCKHCQADLGGASQRRPSDATNADKFQAYDDVPWYRKNWFAIVCGLFFTPALLPVVLTGNVYYQDPSTYDTWVFQVIGVFATADGMVVGKPFPISSKARTVQVPSGAVQLQLGMNDCLNGDNSPAPLTIQVSPSQASSTEGQPTITAGPADAVAAPKTSS